MISRIPPGAMRRRAGLLVVAAMLTVGLLIAGGQTPARAAGKATAASRPPAVDITFKNNHPPTYPADAMKKGRQGAVMLRVTVDATGKITDIAVDPKGTTGAADLQTVSIEAAQGWKFHPGMKDGKPSGGTMFIPVRFSLTPVDPCKDGEAYSATLNKCIRLVTPATP